MREYTRAVLLDKNTSLDINKISHCGGLYIFLTGEMVMVRLYKRIRK